MKYCIMALFLNNLRGTTLKSLKPWGYITATLIAATTSGSFAFASDGMDAYRQGNYTKAAEQLAKESNKDPIVDYYMGRMRLYGYGLLKNNTIALRYFQQAAGKGFLPAQRILALHFLLEENNPEQALYWFKKAADSNDTQAQMYCAAAYLYGLGVKKNSELAKKYYIPAAKSGNALAQITLAEDFLDSRQSANKKLGLIWLNKAVAQGNPEAQVRLGEMTANGKLVDADMVQAKALVGLAVAQKYVPAMYQMGELALKENNPTLAKEWFTKAAMVHYAPAEIALAHLYMQPKSAIYNEHLGFLWMLKAAQNGSSDAQIELSDMYQAGKGVEVDVNLAKEWKDEAKKNQKETIDVAQTKAALWLSMGKSKNLRASGYQLTGIFSQWKNPTTLVNNNYNPAPKMDVLTRETLYKPSFKMTNPNEIPMNEYYDALASQLGASSQSAALDFSHYALEKPDESQLTGLSDEQIITYLQGRAVLGDSSAQFALGQRYQDGIGVAKDSEAAIKQYTLATAQQELRAEYNLGLMYLEGQGVAVNTEKGITLLRDAAFKGNDYAQYALARMDELGYRTAEGEIIVQPDAEQAMVMYDLAAANDSSMAQFRLAEMLVRDKKTGLSISAQKNRVDMIKHLYQSASKAGIEQAALPLAFFNAMSSDKTKQSLAFDVAKKEASLGHDGAAVLLGLLYDRGIGVTADPSEALDWYQKASPNAVTAYILGTYYSQGTGLHQNLEKGTALLEQAAEANFSPAPFNLAVIKQQAGETFLPQLEKSLSLGNTSAGLLIADYYVSSDSNDLNKKEARDIYQNLADKGDKDAQLKLGFMLDKGLGGSVDSVQAEKWYGLAAEQGQVLAQYMLAHLYQIGSVGNGPDYDLAKKWYSQAQSTYSPASVALGFIYDTVDDNYKDAFSNYQHAANHHDPMGLYDLGLIYENGKGQATDYEKAQALYQEAADLGLPQAMTQLAGLYFKGLGVSKDEDLALNWYKKSADLGNADALYQLGLLSETGVSMPLNLSDSLHYYQRSSDKGNAKATLALARMYQYGVGVNKDIERAQKYYNSLADLNSGYAQYQLAMIEEKGMDIKKLSSQEKQLLEKAKENGDPQALRILQLSEAQDEHNISYIEPVILAQSSAEPEQPAKNMYLEALSEWNRGNEGASRQILERLTMQFPDYDPAKQAYQQLKQRT